MCIHRSDSMLSEHCTTVHTAVHSCVHHCTPPLYRPLHRMVIHRSALQLGMRHLPHQALYTERSAAAYPHRTNPPSYSYIPVATSPDTALPIQLYHRYTATQHHTQHCTTIYTSTIHHRRPLACGRRITRITTRYPRTDRTSIQQIGRSAYS